jgi:hypothetical protein
MKPDSDALLDSLFRAARHADPDEFPTPLGFETRVLARLREERRNSLPAFCWRLSPLFASLLLLAMIWLGRLEAVESPTDAAWLESAPVHEELLLLAFPADLP